MCDSQNWIWVDGDEKTHTELCREPLGEYDSILYHGADWFMDEKHKKLIAAAPKMLEALRKIAIHSDDPDMAEIAKAAIALAESQT